MCVIVFGVCMYGVCGYSCLCMICGVCRWVGVVVCVLSVMCLWCECNFVFCLTTQLLSPRSINPQGVQEKQMQCCQPSGILSETSGILAQLYKRSAIRKNTGTFKTSGIAGITFV